MLEIEVNEFFVDLYLVLLACLLQKTEIQYENIDDHHRLIIECDQRKISKGCNQIRINGSMIASYGYTRQK